MSFGAIAGPVKSIPMYIWNQIWLNEFMKPSIFAVGEYPTNSSLSNNADNAEDSQF